jgi:glycosyltransferase involved in cell wall biosynthesis
VYFSPCTPPSKEIQESNLIKFRMIHDAIPIIENGMPKSPKDWYYKIYTTINNKDFYLTNSEYTKKDILKFFPFIKDSHIKTTLLGANEKFKPSKESSPIDERYIFSLCSLGKRKNLEFAIKNFYKFIDKNNISDLKLVLGGSVWNKYRPVLKKILADYDQSKVILAGYIDEKDLPRYYSNALCFIYPSLYEGFGLPVLEAMQCGCPVITSNTTSLPEVIGDAGIQINPKSDEEMIAAYEKMYFDTCFREGCSQRGFERAKQFSWAKCAKEILDFINNTLTV